MPELDTLPEEDKQTDAEPLSQSIPDSEVDGRTIDSGDQFAQDKQPGGSSSDSGPSQPSLLTTQAKAKGIRGFIKRHKALTGIMGVFSALLPFAVFFLFLFLFKLNHIKELFIDYRFAQFDRVVAERLRVALDEAKTIEPGTADAAPAAKDAPLESQLAQAKADGLDPEMKSEEIAKLESQVETLAKSDLVDQAGAEIDDAFKIQDRDVDVVDETGKSSKEVDAAYEEDFRKRIDDPESSKVPEGAGEELKEGVKEAKEDIAKGADPEEALEKASKGAASKFASGATEILSAAAKVTIVCIALDIWGAGRDAYIAYKAGGLVRAAETLYTWADGQKQGKSPLSGIGAMAGRFDNEKESFINGAGAQQAAGQPVTGPGLDANASPSADPPFGDVGKAINLIAKLPKVEAVCHELLKPAVQLAIAGGSIAIIVAAVASGGTTLTATAVLIAIAQGVAVMAAGPIGKALIVHEVASLAHAGISESAGPVAQGNFVSGGTKIMADNTCFKVGCKQMTPSQAQALNSAIRQEQIAKAKQKGLAYRLVATSNPRSALSQTLFALPSSPPAMFGRMNQFFASVLNPARLAAATGHLAISTIGSPSAYAADNGIDPVTHQYYVGTPVGTARFDKRQNDTYIEKQMPASTKAELEKCYQITAKNYATRIIKGPSSDCDKQDTVDAQRYAQYKADQLVTHAIMLLKNKNPIPTAGGGSTGGTAGATIDLNTVYQPSDNVACTSGTNEVGNVTGYHNDAPIQIKLCTLPNLTSSSSESTPGDAYYINGANGLALVNSRASGAFLALAGAAKAAGLPIAATSTFRTMQHQQDLFNGDSGGAEVAVPGRSNHQMGLAIDFSCNGSLVARGDQCFTWLEQNAGKYGISNLPSEAWHWSVDGH